MLKINLANIYLYEFQSNEKIDEAIELLIKSFQFKPSQNLLCISLLLKIKQKHQNESESNKELNSKLIKKEIKGILNCSSELLDSLLNIIMTENLVDNDVFVKKYEEYKNIDFIYNQNCTEILYSELKDDKNQNQNDEFSFNNLSPGFYEGFHI